MVVQHLGTPFPFTPGPAFLGCATGSNPRPRWCLDCLLPATRPLQLAYILGRHGLSLNLEEGPAAVEDEELREQLQAIIR